MCAGFFDGRLDSPAHSEGGKSPRSEPDPAEEDAKGKKQRKARTAFTGEALFPRFCVFY